jgi:hypothetical protein
MTTCNTYTRIGVWDHAEWYGALVRSIFMASTAKSNELSSGRDPIQDRCTLVFSNVGRPARMPSKATKKRKEQ